MTNPSQPVVGEMAARLDRFGERVRLHRTRQALSQSDLSRLTFECGFPMTGGMIGAVERGNRRASLAQAFVLADALDMPLAVLLGGVPAIKRAEARADGMAADLAALLHRYGYKGTLADGGRAETLELVRSAGERR